MYGIDANLVTAGRRTLVAKIKTTQSSADSKSELWKKARESHSRYIYQSLLNLHGPEFRNIQVHHDVKLQSITTPSVQRQIDVYWEFELAGIIYKTCVQAKDCNKRIELGAIDTFRAVLLDIAGQPRGIMVTRKGLQKGADDHARSLGIDLMELNDADEQTLRDSTVHIKTHANNWGISYYGYQPDGKWMLENGRTGFQYGFYSQPGDTPIFRENGSILAHVKDLVHPDKTECGTFEHEHWFQEPAFVQTGEPSFPRVKILSVKTTIKIFEILPLTEVKRYVSQLFKSVTGGQNYTVDSSNTVRKEGEPITFNQDWNVNIGGKDAILRVQINKKEEIESPDEVKTHVEKEKE